MRRSSGQAACSGRSTRAREGGHSVFWRMHATDERDEESGLGPQGRLLLRVRHGAIAYVQLAADLCVLFCETCWCVLSVSCVGARLSFDGRGPACAIRHQRCGGRESETAGRLCKQLTTR